MSKDDRELIERAPAQFFFEVGFGAAYAQALIANDMKPPFTLTDAIVEHAWEIAGEAHDDPEEFDRYLSAATRLEALQAQPVGEAIGDIAVERQRQIAAEGWAPDHDDAHTDRSLAQAGACYVLHDVRCLPMDRRGKLTNQLTPELWPWEHRWWKPKSYRENLVRGAALIVAEIERLDREASHNG